MEGAAVGLMPEAGGFTKAVIAENYQYTLELLVKPDTDFDGAFKAWDVNANEFIRVNGWLFIIEEQEARDD